jgi:hypothetical protein
MMPLLVYCIMNRPAEGGGVITGLKNCVVSFVEGGGLWAAVSDTPSQDGAPPVSDLVVYGRVVEALHRRVTVIPMRYGCFLTGIPELQRLLQEKAHEYKILLKELEGHVEMGIRILLPERAEKPPQRDQPVTGRDYLAVRRAHYGVSEGAFRHHESLVDRYDHAFWGLYSKSRMEADERGGRVVVSLYYLIPENTVGLFKEAFARTTTDDGTKTLVSGPWPPYNYVITIIM